MGTTRASSVLCLPSCIESEIKERAYAQELYVQALLQSTDWRLLRDELLMKGDVLVVV